MTFVFRTSFKTCMENPRIHNEVLLCKGSTWFLTFSHSFLFIEANFVFVFILLSDDFQKNNETNSSSRWVRIILISYSIFYFVVLKVRSFYLLTFTLDVLGIMLSLGKWSLVRKLWERSKTRKQMLLANRLLRFGYSVVESWFPSLRVRMGAQLRVLWLR